MSVYSLAAEWERQVSEAVSIVAGTSWNEQSRDEADDEPEMAFLLGGKVRLSDRTRIRGSFARQIRFPTLRDLYEVDRGNPSLVPEKTDNFELGIERDILDGRSTVEFVLYRVDAINFIERGPSGLAENFDELRFQGIEINGRYSAAQDLDIELGYTYLDAENRGADAETTAVQNRPKHKLSLRADYDLSSGTSFYAATMFVSDSLALSRTSPVETTELGDYNVIDIGVSQSLLDGKLRLTGRVENLLDENYEESFGFPQPGRRFYLAVTLGF